MRLPFLLSLQLGPTLAGLDVLICEILINLYVVSLLFFTTLCFKRLKTLAIGAIIFAHGVIETLK